MTASKRARARELRRALTPAERALWNVLRHDALGMRFRRQMPIRGFIVDFACPRARLAIEVDGPVHDEQTAYDRERDRALALESYRVMRFTNDDVMNDIEEVLDRIRAALPSSSEEGRARERTSS